MSENDGSQPLRLADEAASPPKRRWAVLAIILVATFMDLLDVSIVAIAIPSIQEDLQATYTSAQWMLAGYSLAFALLLITGGRLGDIAGRKRIFLIGMGGFTVASALCGFATSPEMLVASRVIQGAMAAMMVPQVISTIQVIFPPKERGNAFAIYGGIAGLATISGPLLGGLLLNADLFGSGWRSIFLINLPLGVAAFVAAIAIMPEVRVPLAHTLRLDLVGSFLITVTMLLLMFPLIQGRDLDWPVWALVMMGASVIGLLIFGAHQRARAAKNASPLVPPSLFRKVSFTGGLFVNLAFFAGIVSFFLVFIIYLQAGRGESVLSAALTLLPWSVGIAVASGMGFQLAPKLGRSVLQIGATLMTVAMGGVILTIQMGGADASLWWYVPSMLIGGVGMGLVAPLLVDAVVSDIPHTEAGSASGVLSAIQQAGGALGIALVGLIFFGSVSGGAQSVAESVTPQIRTALEAAGAPGPSIDEATRGFVRCFVDRAEEKDPTAVPASCKEAQSPQQGVPAAVEQAFTKAADDGRADLFNQAMTNAALYNGGIFVLTFLLVFLLPRRINVHAEADAGAPEETPEPAPLS
ncbi:EmrB/QacA subfamily drug resistance transporter [Nonomuraea polychroma]|uniref:EmrB/QacA subfamily drug resistance transporter n=1 Tax=Nonomuraea polychroma TaxID=46176 RepID=A0A438MEJ8_9ACTN|nr:MFS transporter [Nonomuraea polychroma]RVX44146.1 EmrB/QacA subfamily drug resistance transporter [Nonomuraea polychroma]